MSEEDQQRFWVIPIRPLFVVYDGLLIDINAYDGTIRLENVERYDFIRGEKENLEISEIEIENIYSLKSARKIPRWKLWLIRYKFELIVKMLLIAIFGILLFMPLNGSSLNKNIVLGCFGIIATFIYFRLKKDLPYIYPRIPREIYTRDYSDPQMNFETDSD